MLAFFIVVGSPKPSAKSKRRASTNDDPAAGLNATYSNPQCTKRHYTPTRHTSTGTIKALATVPSHAWSTRIPALASPASLTMSS